MSVHKPTGPRTLILTEPEQLSAMGHPVRTRLLQALEIEPASAKRLAERLKMSHGKVGHHLKVLERAGLIEVSEERRVRAMTERIFSPAFDILRIAVPGETGDRLTFLFDQAAREAAPADSQPFTDHARLFSVRMPVERAAEFARRLVDLGDEFAAAGDREGLAIGFAGAVYAIDLPEEP